jgi:hypothetical protein
MDEIIEIVNRETIAWNEKNVELLLSIFHHDMVWVWPKSSTSHNPVDWEIVMGKFDRERWKNGYDNLFKKYVLVKNVRTIEKIELSSEKDGAFAVVDIDTVWKNEISNELMIWKGRTCKTYVKNSNGWKMIAQVGTLDYSKM